MGKSGERVERTITEDMRASAEVSAAQWNDYQQRYAPFEQKFANDVLRDSGLVERKVQGQVNADLQQKMATRQGPQAGLDPSRGQAVSSSALGRGLATGQVAAQIGAGNQQVANLSTVVGMGRGQAVDAVGTMSDLAVSSGQAALTRNIADANESMNERGAWMQLAGQAMGAAGAYGMNMGQQGTAATALGNKVATNANQAVASGGNSLLSTTPSTGPAIQASNYSLLPAGYNRNW